MYRYLNPAHQIYFPMLETLSRYCLGTSQVHDKVARTQNFISKLNLDSYEPNRTHPWYLIFHVHVIIATNIAALNSVKSCLSWCLRLYVIMVIDRSIIDALSSSPRQNRLSADFRWLNCIQKIDIAICY